MPLSGAWIRSRWDACYFELPRILVFSTHFGEYVCSYPLAPAWLPLVAAKIILLGDVPICTILYAVLVVEASDHRTHKRSLRP